MNLTSVFQLGYGAALYNRLERAKIKDFFKELL